MSKNNKKLTVKTNEQPVQDKKVIGEVVEMMEATNFKESNEHDVKKAEVVVSYMTEQMKLEHERKLVELEIKKLVEKHAQSVNERKLQAEAKEKMVNKIADTAVRIGTLAAVTTVACISMANNKEVRLEEIRLGAEE